MIKMGDKGVNRVFCMMAFVVVSLVFFSSGVLGATCSTPGPISSCCDITASGTYTLTEDVGEVSDSTGDYCFNIMADDVTLECDGGDIDPVCTGSNCGADFGIEGDGGVYSNRDNTVVRNCEIDGSQADPGLSAIFLDGATNSIIENNNLTNNDEDGVKIVGGHDFIIQENGIFTNGFGISIKDASSAYIMNNSIMSNDFHGIYLQDSNYNTINEENYIWDNGWDGISLESDSSHNVIDDNDIYLNGNGINVYDSSHNNLSNNEIVDNTFGGVVISGRIITSWGSAVENRIEDNNIEGNTANGIRVSKAYKTVIKGNNITYTVYGSSAPMAIQLSGASRTVISDNDIYGNNGWGIWAKNGYTLTIDFNRIYDNNQDGIYIDRVGFDIEINNNMVGSFNVSEKLANDGNGLYMKNIDYPFDIYSNNFSSNGRNNIYLFDVNGGYGYVPGDIKDNIVYNATENGILLKDVSRILIQSNAIVLNHDDGIRLENAYDVNINRESEESNKNFIAYNGGDGIYFDEESKKGSIIDSIVFNNVRNGIFLDKFSTPIGIYVNESFQIKNNNVSSNKERGIYSYKSHGVDISGNDVNDNEWSGIYLWISDNNVNYNTANSNGKWGIYISTWHDNYWRQRNDYGNTAKNNCWNTYGIICADVSSSGLVKARGANTYLNGAPIGLSLSNVTKSIFENYTIYDVNYSIVLNNSHSNAFYNFNIIDSRVLDIVLENNSYDNVFVNTSYNVSKVSVEAGSNYSIGWFYGAYVNDTYGNLVPGASVVAYDSNDDVDFAFFTNSTGHINKTHLVGYVDDGETKTYAGNYSLNASKGLAMNNHSYNATLEEHNLNDYFTLDADYLPPVVGFVDITPLNGSIVGASNMIVNMTSTDYDDHYSFVDFDNSVIGWWQGDLDGDTVIDSSGNVNGTKSSDVSQVDAKFGEGIHFAGQSSSSVNLGDNYDLGENDVTVSVWVKLPEEGHAGHEGIFGKGAGSINQKGWNLNYRNSTERFVMVISDGVGTRTWYYSGDSAQGLNDSEWHHIVVTIDRDTGLRFFIDGVGTRNYTESIFDGVDISVATNAFIGSWLGGWDLNGTVDELIVFNRSLSADEVTALYGVSVDKYSDDLVGWWRMDDIDGTTVIDKSNYGNNGTIVGDGEQIDGKIGKGFDNKDGNDERIELTLSDSLSMDVNPNFTLSAWVNFTEGVTDVSGIFGWGNPFNNNGSGVIFDYDPRGASHKLRLQYDNGSVGATVKEISGDLRGEWHQVSVVVSRIAGTVEFFVDGASIGSESFTAQEGSVHDAPWGTTGGIARYGQSTIYGLKGYIDDVMMFKKALSADEIAALYEKIANQYENDFTGLADGSSHSFTGYSVDSEGNVAQTETRNVEVWLPPIFNLTVDYPTTNMNVNQNEFFTVNVTAHCLQGNCGEISVSLDPIRLGEDGELLDKRTYNQKVFTKDNGGEKYKIYVGDIHYKDNDEFEDIDTTLIETRNGWTMDEASYSLVIPKYSNGSFEFTNEYEDAKGDKVDMVPVVVNSVEGVKISDNTILYADAFGRGIDLKVIAKNGGFDKLVVINDKPNDLTEDLEFAFEINLDDFDVSSDGVGWDRVNDREVVSKVVLNNKGNTFFREFKVWDSARNREKIDVKLVERNGKYYLIKVLSKEFLEDAVYPVFTDDTLSYDAGNGDGEVYTNCAVWSICHDATYGDEADYTSPTMSAMDYYWSNPDNYYIYRAFIPINTSGIDDSHVVDSASLYFYNPTGIYDEFSQTMHLVNTSQSSTSYLSTSDFDQVGVIEGAPSLSTGSVSYQSWGQFDLDDIGKSWVNKWGYTKLGIRGYYDLNDEDPKDSGYEGYNAFYIETSEETNGPYLLVETSLQPKGLIPEMWGYPFYVNGSNPVWTQALIFGESETVVYTVNATGGTDATYEFFAFGNLTDDMSNGYVTDIWNVTIV